MSVDDDDDPVVDEIPVYLSHELQDKLFVFQYPCHPAHNTSSKLNIVKSQIKPDNQEVILEVSLDQRNANYDLSHGEQIALNIGQDKAKTGRFSSECVERLELKSQKLDVDVESYAVGRMVSGTLVLTPIRGAVALLPDISSLVSSQEQPSGNVEEEAKMVRVQFSRMETERWKKAKEQSYSYLCQKSAEESWYQTEYHGPGSARSLAEERRLVPRLGAPSIPLASEGYVETLVGPKTTTAADLRPLSDRLLHVLSRVNALSLRTAAQVLSAPESEVLPCLQNCATLVRGVWVLRSDFRFKTVHQGISQDLLIRARDYILSQFVEGKALQRYPLSETLKLPPDLVLEILQEVGRINSKRAWVFRENQDNVFIQRYPEICEQQSLLWEARNNQVMESLGLSKRRRRDSGRKSTGEEPEAGKRGRRKSDCADVKPDITQISGVKS